MSYCAGSCVGFLITFLFVLVISDIRVVLAGGDNLKNWILIVRSFI